MNTSNFSTLTFAEAAALWLEERKAGRPVPTESNQRRRHRGPISQGMAHDYEKCIRELCKVFGGVRLDTITADDIRAYQENRMAAIVARHKARGDMPEDSGRVGASRINHECCTLGQVLAVAGLWRAIQPNYVPMALPETCGIALEIEEEAHLFEVAASQSKWFVAYCASLISVGTTRGPGEIRHLQLRDIDLERRLIHFERGVKTTYRKKTIPMNPDVEWAVAQLMARAKEKGACEPEHYLLPHRARAGDQTPDPTRPVSGWYKAWNNLCAEAAKKYPRLAKITPYTLRHTAGTRLMENPNVSLETVRAIMGHAPNSKILERYSHIKMLPKKEAVRVLIRARLEPEKKPSRSAGSTLAYLRFLP